MTEQFQVGTKMDKFTRLLALVATTIAFAGPAVAAPVTTAPVSAATPATATAQIVDPLTLTKTKDLNFGTLIKNVMTATRTVTIKEDGTITCSIELLCGGTTSSAAFDVLGSASQIVKVYVLPSTLNGPGTATLNFTPTTASASPLTLDSGGAGSFKVGGSIAVTPTTTAGVYSGNMDVTVDYN
jgi:spore coat protein U-like protein